MEKDEYPVTISVKEAAQLMGVCLHTAYQVVGRGEIPSIRFGGGKRKMIRVPRAALMRLLQTGASAGFEYSKSESA